MDTQLVNQFESQMFLLHMEFQLVQREIPTIATGYLSRVQQMFFKKINFPLERNIGFNAVREIIVINTSGTGVRIATKSARSNCFLS